MALASGMLGALIPTLSARRNPLVLVASSACLSDSLELWELVQAGRSGSDPALAYVEWAAAGGFEDPGCQIAGCLHTRGTVGCALDDRERWLEANPGILRGRITERFIQDVERRRMAPLEFARERLGWHEKPIDPNTAADRCRRTGWGRRMRVRRRWVRWCSRLMCRPRGRARPLPWRVGARTAGPMWGSWTAGMASDWLLDRIVELLDAHDVLTIPEGSGAKVVYAHGVVIDPVSPGGDPGGAARQRGIDPVLMSTREVGTACAQLQDGLSQGTVWHRDAPDVDVALEGAAKRNIGEGQWAFGRRKSADAGVEVDPAVAVTNAAWCVSLVEEYDLTTSVW